MTPRQGDARAACAELTYLAEPADPILGALLQVLPPDEVVAAIRSGNVPAVGLDEAQAARIRPVQARWQARLAAVPPRAGIGVHEARGIRLICPGDPGWPAQLNDLGVARPYALWVRGTADLRAICGQSVAVVGARAATAYGAHVCTEIAADLSVDGWTIVSGGAFGIDACAHRGALAARGITIAVLASGVDEPYPQAHHELFEAIASHGALVSEWPPDRAPTRSGFLLRNRLVAAISGGTVVVEAAARSGTLVTARHAHNLGRPLMAVPGPVICPELSGQRICG